MSEARPKLLIVEDDLDLADMLTAYFRVEGYDVITVDRGLEGVQSYQSTHPDLIILDTRLPDIDGVEVARRLRGDHHSSEIPIIFMTDKRELIDSLKDLELSVDGFITKPFDIQELRLRVRNVLRRANQDSLTNPVTGLPEGKLVDEHLLECIKKPVWTMLVVLLENLDAFRDTYGFVASDDVLRAVSVMLRHAIRETGSLGDFLGHIDSASFVLVTVPEMAHRLKERVSGRLERSLEYFYPIKDREKSARKNKRLVFKIFLVQSKERDFSSLEVLKETLLRKK